MLELKILSADDQPLIRLGLRTILEAQPGWSVCAEAATGREAVALAVEHRPDVVITGISLPGINGLDATRQIRRQSPETEVLILTRHHSDKLVAEAFAAGVSGYLLKTDNLRLLLAAVETIGHRKSFVSGAASGAIAGGRLPRNGVSPGEVAHRALSLREREIVQLLAEGKSNKEIAVTLGISVNTVNTHRTNIMRRLEFHSVADLVRYAIRETLIAA